MDVVVFNHGGLNAQASNISCHKGNTVTTFQNISLCQILS